MLDLYLDAGGNVVDTADSYTSGASEDALGRLIGSRRDRIVLSTKYTIMLRPNDPNGGGSHRRRLVEALDSSLRRLGTDHIDLYWVHLRDRLTPIEETMRALDDQIRLGKVLYIGVSDWPAWEVSRANAIAELRDWTPFAAQQIQYNLIERTPERELLPMAAALGLSVIAWSPLAGGRLTGKYLEQAAVGRAIGPGRTAMDSRTEPIIRETAAVARELGAPTSQVALAWLLSRNVPVIPLVGATSEQQLAENLGALDITLTPDYIERLDAASAIELGFPHDLLASEHTQQLLYGEFRPKIDAET
jgi:aryl-alcohol dehydrogenase-like predicted oxidoreductase